MLTRRSAILGLTAIAIASTPAPAATPYPCDYVPVPVLCYSTEKLAAAYNGPAFIVEKQRTVTAAGIFFLSDGHLDTTTLNAFQAGESYSRVTQWNNQVFGANNAIAAARVTSTGNTTTVAPDQKKISNIPNIASIQIGMAVIGAPFSDGTQVLTVDVPGNFVTVFDAAESITTATPLIFTTSDTPRIKIDRNIGSSRALVFEGASHSGRVFGLDIDPALSMSPQTYTAFMVIRPTSSMYRNQQFTPGLGSGTVLSLEREAPFALSGDTTAGSPTVLNVTPIAGVSPGMVFSTPSDGPFPEPVTILSITPTTPGVGNVTMSGANAVTNKVGASLMLSNPLARFYSNGDSGPGEMAVKDQSAFTFEPQDTMIEAAPIVLSFTSDATGVKQWQNEVIRTTTARSARSEGILRGYLGRMGLSQAGPFSKSGDFWASAVLVYDVALTQRQRAYISAALYERFSIRQARSRPGAKNFIYAGDSIPAGYVTLGLYGMFAHLQELLPNVRMGNYTVPGSQVTSIVGSPIYGYTQGMFPGSMAPNLTYSKTKNILVVLGGGNDMVSLTAPFTAALTVPGSTITSVAHGLVVGGRVFFNSNGDVLPAGVAFGPTYWVKNVLSPDTFNISATPTGPVISFSVGVPPESGTHQIISAPKTANSIYAGIVDVVQQGITAGAAKAFVIKVLPRIGTIYNSILPDLNTCIVSGAGGGAVCGAASHPAYTVIDPYLNACMAANPDPPGSSTVGACYFDAGHPNDLGHATMATQVLYPVLSLE